MVQPITLHAGLCGDTVEPCRVNPLAWARRVWFSVALVLTLLMVAVAASMGPVLDQAVEASLVALCVAIAARHDGIVRAAFVIGRWRPSCGVHQLTYHVGQLHRAMAIAGTVWFVLAVTAASARGDDIARIGGLVVLAILLAMIWTAQDAARRGRHDRFEVVHRYGGWAALAVLVVLVLRHAATSAAPDAAPVAMLGEPSVLLLAVLLALVVHPWMGVQRLPTEILDVTDQVVIVALPGRRALGEFLRVSREGREWHSFAVATTGAERDGWFCLVIRRAGDWTERLARDAQQAPPMHLYARRMRGYGFMYHAQTYRRVLIVATGAGIGPVLPYLVGPSPVDVECLWIGRDHRAAMGDDLVRRLLAGGRVSLVDSSCGRPDVGALVAERARHFEAVFVVSNEQVRDDVAAACSARCVPWYGPTFDS
jgi:hypothetical protein